VTNLPRRTHSQSPATFGVAIGGTSSKGFGWRFPDESERAVIELVAASNHQGLSTRSDEKWIIVPISPAISSWVVNSYPRFQAEATERIQVSGSWAQALSHLLYLDRPPQEIALPPSIRVVDVDQVLQLVRAHPEIKPVITEAQSRLSALFSTDAFVLRGNTDPETDLRNADEPIVLAVQTGLDPAEASALLDRFDSEWWIDAPANVRRLLIVTVDFT
jgi:hypothetical protein